MKRELKEVFVVEDSDKKFEDIVKCINEAIIGSKITRAATMTEAERGIKHTDWDLIVLDISLDIAPSRHGSKGRGQANLGGLGIAQKMFLLNREAPTIIVTAFDSFTASNVNQGGSEILGFEEVQAKASSFLSLHLVACLRYNSRTWRVDMINAVRSAVAL